MLKKISPYWLWALLALPAIGFTVGLVSNPSLKTVHELLHPTGEFSARFLIIAMIATPLTLLLPGWRGPRWLVKNRRYFGVAAFGYALYHTVLYLIDKGSLTAIFGEAFMLSIWTGWIAFIIFVPLAITSTNGFVRSLGRNWKRLQRFVYIAAVLTLLHWAALHDWGGVGPALVHFVPLGLLEGYRVWHRYGRRKTAAI